MIENSPSIDINHEAKGRLMRLATYASVSVALTLIVVKFFAYIATDSISILSTLVDSTLDAGASMINLLAVRHALQPADNEHRFGHGKAEPLAALAQAAFICGSGVFVLIQAGERFLNPQEIARTDVGYAVMAFSIVLTIALVGFQRYVVSKSGSVAISADSLHFETDVLINVCVVVSLFVVSSFGWAWADPAIAILIVFYIVRGAYRIGMGALDILMDRELDEAERERITKIILAQEGVSGLHDLRTRSSGLHIFIQFHLEMNGDITLRDAHIISETVEAVLFETYPNAELIIHEDPEGVIEKRAHFDE